MKQSWRKSHLARVAKAFHSSDKISNLENSLHYKAQNASENVSRKADFKGIRSQEPLLYKSIEIAPQYQPKSTKIGRVFIVSHPLPQGLREPLSLIQIHLDNNDYVYLK